MDMINERNEILELLQKPIRELEKDDPNTTKTYHMLCDIYELLLVREMWK